VRFGRRNRYKLHEVLWVFREHDLFTADGSIDEIG